MEDDGRTIAPMNVEGMPWYTPKQLQGSTGGSVLDKRQARPAMWGALAAGLTVVGVISVGIILFVLFCTQVWFA